MLSKIVDINTMSKKNKSKCVRVCVCVCACAGLYVIMQVWCVYVSICLPLFVPLP